MLREPLLVVLSISIVASQRTKTVLCCAESSSRSADTAAPHLMAGAEEISSTGSAAAASSWQPVSIVTSFLGARSCATAAPGRERSSPVVPFLSTAGSSRHLAQTGRTMYHRWTCLAGHRAKRSDLVPLPRIQLQGTTAWTEQLPCCHSPLQWPSQATGTACSLQSPASCSH